MRSPKRIISQPVAMTLGGQPILTAYKWWVPTTTKGPLVMQETSYKRHANEVTLIYGAGIYMTTQAGVHPTEEKLLNYLIRNL